MQLGPVLVKVRMSLKVPIQDQETEVLTFYFLLVLG